MIPSTTPLIVAGTRYRSGTHRVNAERLARRLAPLVLGLLRQARGGGFADSVVLDQLRSDARLREAVVAAAGHRRVPSVDTFEMAWREARRMGARRC